MANARWIKIVTDIFDDDKMLLIESLPEADSIIVIWFKLLCLAGKQNNSGVFLLNNKIRYTDEMFSTIFRRPINTVRLALNTFEQFGMIEYIDDVITIPNWGKHQSLDQLESKKEYMKKYMQKYRAKQKLLSSGKETNCKTNNKSNVSRVDKSREEKKRKEKEVEVVVSGANAPDYTDTDSKLDFFRGEVMLSENQIADLLNKLGLEMFDEYVDRLNAFIKEKNATVKNHYETILKWYNEDRAVKM